MAETGVEPVAVLPSPPIGRSQHCVLFAVDVARLTDGRDDDVRLAVRDAFYRLLVAAFEDAGIPWDSCVHEGRGDRVVVVIPAHMPTITVIDPLVDRVRVRLWRHNRLSSPVAQVRLRLAAHIGEVYRDGYGLAGKALDDLLRMLDAPDLLKTADDLALIVSDYLYRSVVHGGPGDTDPTAYAEVLVDQDRAWLLR
ncbi:hypothetical protein [Actinomadura sp. DC4]|uniref:hypothetical protein n=1 Tax=Actinomadura sp. DC4 TaxID=3055069 RepID=UPI0025B01582|nr:hypothetical protein [Actinomadura sp. DC4]MDN3354655.1 hypothetical protein [Actinomadura sp. DC4]